MNADNGDSFATISSVSGFDFPDDGRSLATVDWDHDGDLDLWVGNRNAPRVRFLRNDFQSENHFLTLRLEGNGTTVPRDAIGSRVTVITNESDKPLAKTVRAGDGFLAQSSKWLLFGLGKANTIKQVTVRWSDGTEEQFTGLTVDGRFRLKIGAGQATAQPTSKRSLKLTPSEPRPLPSSGAARIPCVTLLKLPTIAYNRRPFGSQQTITMGNGKAGSSQKGDGKAVLINLWSSSCLPCIKELNEFSERAKDLEAANVRVVALSIDAGKRDQDEIEAARDIIDRLDESIVTGFTDWKLVFLLQSIHNSLVPSSRLLPIPSSLLIDGEGRLMVIYKGPVGVDQVLADLSQSSLSTEERFKRMFPYGGQAIDHPRAEKVLADSINNNIYSFAFELQTSKRNTSAMALYRDLLRRDPNMTVAHIALGNLSLVKNDLENATKHFQQAAKVDPQSNDAHFGLGAVAFSEERFQDSLAHLDAAIRLAPMNFPAHFTRGKVLVALERNAEAIEAFEIALGIAPKNRQVQDALKKLRRQR